jgi:hypothetical protein
MRAYLVLLQVLSEAVTVVESTLQRRLQNSPFRYRAISTADVQ